MYVYKDKKKMRYPPKQSKYSYQELDNFK